MKITRSRVAFDGLSREFRQSVVLHTAEERGAGGRYASGLVIVIGEIGGRKLVYQTKEVQNVRVVS